MSKKIRLIARLDVKDTNLVKGIQLEGLRKLGDPNAFAKEYYEAGIDELLYIDIVASLYNRNNLSDIVRKTVDDVYIPVCVGGGLRSVEDVRHILSMGADKAAINTAAIKRPALITEVAKEFGSVDMLLTSFVSLRLQLFMYREFLVSVTKAVNVPVICGGGVGCGDDIVDAANAGADAVACAAVLHYKKETVTELKEDIRAGGVEVRQV